jgi:hypothetical protein
MKFVSAYAENADLNNVKATLGGQRLHVLYLEPPAKPAPRGLLAQFRRGPARQANACLTGEPPIGRVNLLVDVGSKRAAQLAVEMKC